MDVVDRRIPLSQIGKTVGPSPVQRFIANVRRNGIVVPVLLREVVGAGGELEYRIIDGNRRVAAARQLRLPDVPARIVIGGSDDDAARLTLMANNFRSANDITEFWAIKQLERSGVTRNRIAQDAGMTIKSLDLRNRWSALDRRIFVGFASGRISASVARKISRLPREDQQELGDLFAVQGRIQTDDIDALHRPKSVPPSVPVYENDMPISDPAQVRGSSARGVSPQPLARSVATSPRALIQPAPWANSEPNTSRHEPAETGRRADGALSASIPEAHPARHDRRAPEGAVARPPLADVQSAPSLTTAGLTDVPQPATIVTEPAPARQEMPAADGLPEDVQCVIEQVAQMGCAHAIPLDSLVDGLRVAYRQAEFVRKVTRESVRG